MENERLLTAHELLVVGMRTAMGDLIELQNETAKAQDAKSIAALIKWLDAPCDKHQDKEKCDQKYFPLKRNCSTCWQELKESVK
jgi:hypothetical protein